MAGLGAQLFPGWEHSTRPQAVSAFASSGVNAGPDVHRFARLVDHTLAHSTPMTGESQ